MDQFNLHRRDVIVVHCAFLNIKTKRLYKIKYLVTFLKYPTFLKALGNVGLHLYSSPVCHEIISSVAGRTVTTKQILSHNRHSICNRFHKMYTNSVSSLIVALFNLEPVFQPASFCSLFLLKACFHNNNYFCEFKVIQSI